MISIIDYGSGNIRSVYNAFRHIGCRVKVCDSAKELKNADKIVLPGVGVSREAMKRLRDGGFIEPLLENIAKGVPFLGICLGLQLLLSRSFEFGKNACLNLIPGEVKRFPISGGLKVPQIGWNTVKFTGEACPLFKGARDESYFYFVHSFFCDVKDAVFKVGETKYGIRYTSAVWKDNIFAVQFHPERSQKNGLKILKNFGEL